MKKAIKTYPFEQMETLRVRQALWRSMVKEFQSANILLEALAELTGRHLDEHEKFLLSTAKAQAPVLVAALLSRARDEALEEVGFYNIRIHNLCSAEGIREVVAQQQ